MYSWELGLLTLILALAASDHLILLHSQEVPPYQTEPLPTPSSSSKYGVIVASGFLLVILVGLCGIFFWCRKRRTRSSGFYPSPEQQSLRESIENANDGNQLLGENERPRGRDEPSAPIVPPQAPLELIQNANGGNQLPSENEHPGFPYKPSGRIVPPQAPLESIQDANSGNQLLCKNEQSRCRDKPSGRIVPPQAPLESIQDANDENQLPGKNKHSRHRDKPSTRTVPPQAPLESIQDANDENQLPGKNKHSRHRDKPSTRIVPPQAPLESIQDANDENQLPGKNEHSKCRNKPLGRIVPPQAPLASIQNIIDGNQLSGKNEHSRGQGKPSAYTVPPQAPLALPSSSKVLELKHIPRIFTYDELHSATKGFDDSNYLGKGGFGTVYKGVLPSNNKIVAIKKLEACARQGIQQFLTEVNVISQAHHKHIVSLVGYYCGQDEGPMAAMMLVYEFIPNNSLAYQLHRTGTKTIDWETRMKIAIGSAKGLTYLHEGCEPKIIHCDIKSANILLTDDFQTKVADFGLAKLLPDTATHVSVGNCMGTFGYLAPECFRGGKMGEKSDVFAFGVVLLELITGQKACGSFSEGMVEWVCTVFINVFCSI
ncbi:putative proline-rich receptor-like protein kinase PERK6 [Neltuma alba]|uniref:putative proline-rich receptor-like protein kinase PERK6 n=1 Tax=Neltuma alba TaxID=207710 RepID=UPI0010A45B9D|nr:putative proline-rich receptor-like protein kinase PERK6 [Prosopis alba]